MNLTRIIAAVCFCFCITALYAQDEPDSKQGFFSLGATMSNYNPPGHSKYISSSKASFGMQLSYWKPLVPHIDFSANLGFVLANFPAGFVKGDSIGQAGVTLHTDALIHLKAFARDAKVNPFLTAGVGWGSFAYQQAFYAPVGAGVAFHFNAGSMLILQGQMREALSRGITNNFMFYSAGFALNIPGSSRNRKEKSDKEEAVKKALTTVDTSKQNAPKAVDAVTVIKNTTDTTVKTIKQNVAPPADSDGDGVLDKDDKCPGVKGSKDNDGCPFPPMNDDDLVSMSADSVTYRIYFDYDRSDLLSHDFDVLNRIVKMLQSDKTLTLHISGYADTQGTQARNMKISAERANVTLDYFLSYHVPSARITMFYYGAGQAVDNIQQWRNRRVEITIIKH
ncbi:MAG TPA: OmpA family protein [Chitinophagaceae bacterium]|nr:OmpA family protein [Chitinophagaceae bacterium]